MELNGIKTCDEQNSKDEKLFCNEDHPPLIEKVTIDCDNEN